MQPESEGAWGVGARCNLMQTEGNTHERQAHDFFFPQAHDYYVKIHLKNLDFTPNGNCRFCNPVMATHKTRSSFTALLRKVDSSLPLLDRLRSMSAEQRTASEPALPDGHERFSQQRRDTGRFCSRRVWETHIVL